MLEYEDEGRDVRTNFGVVLRLVCMLRVPTNLGIMVHLSEVLVRGQPHNFGDEVIRSVYGQHDGRGLSTRRE